jgi:hypothetical protein
MQASAPIRIVSLLGLTLATLLPAQVQRNVYTKSTAAPPASTQPTAVPEIPPTPAQLPAHPASVTYEKGLVTVSASNSSLNQILRDISRQTGMKITGGVGDERVFGKYGPSSTAQVLNTLLDGTNSNMLFVHSDAGKPAQLILTPRIGGPSPPSPNAAEAHEQQADEDNPYQNQPPPPPQPPYRTTPVPNAAAESGAPANPTSEGFMQQQQQTSNGVKTPQEIYDQLMKLRQQQQQSQPPSNTQ